MKSKNIRITNIVLFITFISITWCKCELPSNSYGPPPKPENQPNTAYGVPPSGPPGADQPGSIYGPPPSPDIKPPSPEGSSTKEETGNEEAEPEPFSFMYEVKDASTGNDYNHKQESDGKSVKGEYNVLLPDGRKQTVTYTADKGGFNAQVKYDGEAKPFIPMEKVVTARAGTNQFFDSQLMTTANLLPSGGNPASALPTGFQGYPLAGPPPPAPSTKAGGSPSNTYLPPSNFATH